MTFLRKLFEAKRTAESVPSAVTRTSGDLITSLAGGANLVDGKQAWEQASGSRNNLEVMLKCCNAELETMKCAKVVAAPFYFERAAILLRKSKQYKQEIQLCEFYINAVEHYYSSVAQAYEADLRNGPRFQALKSRVAKARALQGKESSS